MPVRRTHSSIDSRAGFFDGSVGGRGIDVRAGKYARRGSSDALHKTLRRGDDEIAFVAYSEVVVHILGFLRRAFHTNNRLAEVGPAGH